MKYRTCLLPILAVALLLGACGNPSTAADERAGQGGDVMDQSGFVGALKASGASVELQGPISQQFFTPQGQLIGINDAGVQLYEYGSPQSMEKEAALVAPDGVSVGTTMVNWIEPPHFFKAGRIIVLYLGSDAATLDLLGRIMGPQFAGQ